MKKLVVDKYRAEEASIRSDRFDPFYTGKQPQLGKRLLTLCVLAYNESL